MHRREGGNRRFVRMLDLADVQVRQEFETRFVRAPEVKTLQMQGAEATRLLREVTHG